MMGMGTPKMDGSVQPNSQLLQHEERNQSIDKIVYNPIKVQLQVIRDE